MPLGLQRPPQPNIRRTAWACAALWFVCVYMPLPALAQIDLSSEELPVQLTRRDASLNFRSLDVSKGAPDDLSAALMQDSRGFIWSGSFSGLVRYDGFNVKVYEPNPDDSTSIPDGFVAQITETDDGSIWVGGAAGLARLDPATERFERFEHDSTDATSLTDGTVWALFVDSRNVMWVGTSDEDPDAGGLNRYDPSTKTFKRYQHDPDDPQSLSYSKVTAIAEDLAGNMWVGTSGGGLNRFNRDTETFTAFRHDPNDPTSLSHDVVLVIHVDKRGAIRVGTGDFFGRDVNGGLNEFDPITGTFTRYLQDPNDPRSLHGTSVTAIQEDPSGSFWIGALIGGLNHYDPNTHVFTQIGGPASVLSLMEDRSGVLWTGTWDKGARALDRLANRFVHYGHEPGNPESIAIGDVMAIREVPSGSDFLWVGTWGGGLTRVDRTTNRVRRFQPEPGNPYSISHNLVRTIHETRDGTMWVGTWGGLNRYDPATDRFYHYMADPEDPDALSHQAVRVIYEDRAGMMWVGTWGGGLNRFDRATGKFKSWLIDTTSTNPGANQIGSIVEDAKGRLWVGRNGGGLHLFDRETERFEDSYLDADDEGCCNDMLADPDGRLWLGTFGGVHHFDPETGEYKTYSTAEGLGHRQVKGIMRDGAGRLWVATNYGVARFDAAKDRFRNYTEADGLYQSKFESRAYYQSPTGEFYVGGSEGVEAFFPDQIRDDPRAPAVVITDFRLFGESLHADPDGPITREISYASEIALNYDQNDITLAFAGLHFVRPEQNEYSYRLDPYDRDWSKPSHRRTAHYTNLDPGSYTFTVRAANNDGVWNEEGTSLSIVIAPPFWQTWWFRIAVVLLFAGLIYGGVQARIRQIAERNRKLEATVAERTDELKDRNHQLEQSHTIVEAINKETSFRRLLTKILEEARVIPGVEKATAIVRMPDGLFHIRASSGWDVAAMEHIRLTPEQAADRYARVDEEVAPDLFVANEVSKRVGSTEMAEFGAVASFLVLRVKVEDQVAGYLVFDNLTDPGAFVERDVALLERLKEHIESAFIKTRLLESLRDQNDQISTQRAELEKTLSSLQAAQDRLIQSEKMASLGQLTAGIAHEIKNPLNFVNNFSEMSVELTEELMTEVKARKDQLPADFVAELESILEGLKINSDKITEHGKRADSIVQSMLQHSRGGEGEQQTVDVNELLDEYVNLAYHGMRARDSDFNVTLNRAYASGLPPIGMIPQDIGRVFINLLSNAFDALNEYSSRAGGQFKPEVSVSTAQRDGMVEIRVVDNGPGIPEAVSKRIFEPFFTTKPTGSGTGLGLSMSYDIVTKGHGGTLEVLSEEGKGATFIVRLPV
jgi:signal transduction histidine kinase/ligand-binding sensor domain-containing protein